MASLGYLLTLNDGATQMQEQGGRSVYQEFEKQTSLPSGVISLLYIRAFRTSLQDCLLQG